ncbi:hypothetical protein [Mesorhizobium sp.]|uniref:hypothetical protein n=1 Tax=Mesorhizobium sp. TaxID=1871066 RepID=UPI000FE75EE1|nr:hypothetical protein [Mesorhizobium sp.]RWM04715.1 MAG: hypothetical protein EOR71_25745 [Mesorhizobium sp.]
MIFIVQILNRWRNHRERGRLAAQFHPDTEPVQQGLPIADSRSIDARLGAASNRFVSHLKYCHKSLLFNHKTRRPASRQGMEPGS